MEKKGSLSYVIAAILMIILLFGVSYFFTTSSWKGVKSIFGIQEEEDTSQFVYGGCSPAVCSVQALTCAINSIAAGQPAWRMPDAALLCPGLDDTVVTNDKTPPTDKSDSATTTPDVGVKKVVLPSHRGDSLKALAREVLDCWSTFNRYSHDNILCKEIVVPNDFEGTIFEDMLMQQLCKMGPNGVELCGSQKIDANLFSKAWGGTKNLFNFENLNWDINKISKGSSPIYICSDNSGVNHITLTDNIAHCDYSYIANPQVDCGGVLYGTSICLQCSGTPLDCKVKSFELPQPITNVEEWLLDYGDPLYLVYYEKFPQGEDRAWTAEASTLFMIGFVVRIGIDAIPLVSKVIPLKKLLPFSKLSNLFDGGRLKGINSLAQQLKNSKLAPETRQQILLKMSRLVDETGEKGLKAFFIAMQDVQNSVIARDLADDVVNAVIKESTTLQVVFPEIKGAPNLYIQNGVFTQLGRDTLTSKLQSTLLEIGVSTDVAKRSAAAFESSLSTAKITDDIEKIARTSISEAQSGLDEIARQVIRRGLTPSQAKLIKRVGFERAARAYYAIDTAEETARSFEKLFPSISRLRVEDPATYTKYMTEVDDTFRALFDTRVDDVAGILLDDAVAPSAQKAMSVLAKDDVAQSMLDMGLATGTRAEVSNKVYSGIDWLKNDAKSVWQCVSGSGILRTTASAAAGIGIASRVYAQTDSEEVAALAALGTYVGANARTCLDFLRYNYYPLLIATSVALQKADANNQKFIPSGTNKLAVVMPTVRTEVGDMEGYELTIGDNYLALSKENSDSARFFLASPCKADVRVQTSYISCDLVNDQYVYTQTDEKGVLRYIPIEPVKSSSDMITPLYGWTSATPEQKEAFFSKGQDLGDSWWTNFKGGNLIQNSMYDLIVHNPLYKKYAYKLVFNAYPKADHSYFYQTLEVGLHLLDSGSPDYPLASVNYGGTFQNVVSNFDAEYQDSVEKIAALLQRETVNGEFSNSNIACYSNLLDSLVDFSFLHEEGDPTPFILTCGSEDLSIPGFITRFMIEELDTPYLFKAAGLGQSADTDGLAEFFSFPRDLESMGTGFLGRIHKVEYKGAEWYADYLDSYGTSPLRVKNWDSLGAWDEWMKYYNVLPEEQKDPTISVFLSGFFDYVAQQAAHQIYIYNGDRANLVKTCVNPATVSVPQIDVDGNLQSIDAAALKTTVSSISVKAEGIDGTYKGWNGGNNYCYSDINPSLEIGSKVLTWGSIVGGIGIMLIPGGQAQGAVLTLSAADASAAVIALIIEKCSGWPIHAASLDLRKCWSS